MNKQELMKECNKIILATNGGNDDFVVALCRISEAIGRLDEPSREECEFIEWSVGDDRDYGGCVDGAKCTNCDYFEAWYCDCDKFNFCPNCGSKIKRN